LSAACNAAGVGRPDPHHAATGEEVRERDVGDQAALGEDHDVVDGVGHFGQKMTRDQHGASRGGVGAQKVAQPLDSFGVEAVGRLVEDQHVGIAQQGGGESETLPHAQREAAHPSPGDTGEADRLEHLADTAGGHTARGGQDPQMGVGPSTGMKAGSRARRRHGASVRTGPGTGDH
jgi:hypothetical protein